jgi:hypothetical protein
MLRWRKKVGGKFVEKLDEGEKKEIAKKSKTQTNV